MITAAQRAAAGGPRQIVGKLDAEVLQAIRVSDISDALARQGTDPAGSTPVNYGKRAEFDTHAAQAELAGGELPRFSSLA
ncbi:MAG: hypothetical protein A3G24_27710 [Betaproteobacteria bacterium RIFCSPLOWO2_12_FULL_62_13]|nr:MAG: hypothetical protein A3G24_27710 [Betaproteobacteria bacterium RIFCSPLOWO2_12_FULL_62_13]